MAEFTREQLALRAGVPPDYVERLVELGIVTPGEGAFPFSLGDLRRARFVRGLDEGGIPLETVASAVQSGALSFAFFDARYWDRFAGLTEKTYRELSAESHLSVDLLQTVRESMGFARPEPDELVREDELEVVPLMKALIGMGADPIVLERHIRIWGDNLRRLSEADGSFYRSQILVPLFQTGLSWSDVVHVASEGNEMMVPLLDPALVSLYHAQSERTWMANIVEAVEATLEQAGLHRRISQPPAMCFLDLSGYTRLTEERGDVAAAEMAATLGNLVQRSSHEREGRPVKWLGDGVMVFFRKPAAAVPFALDMRERIPAAELPPAHIGIDAGPVIFQDGDYFGRTVNVAARIAAYAQAGQVLVSHDAKELSADAGVEFVDLGSVELKGVSRPVRLHEARSNGPEALGSSGEMVSA